ncbi:hypothetical protein LH427_12575 [Laribacter hongkongensis]|uniref:hypothetical protein n=1 Tax=Laribacter hongkongensis TaxID=168471 RepID=UPI001EFE89DD|nr:hypothetical protein [Laribacter hongkongensis]MCG8998138.1 hypothetical protein [Laribacter hongkongensis]MCG9062742.1 hypothetical protein [Laribacter hongkongensis]
MKQRLDVLITRLRYALAQRRVVRLGVQKFRVATDTEREKRAIRDAAEAYCRQIDRDSRVLFEQLSYELDEACRYRQVLKEQLGMSAPVQLHEISTGEAIANAVMSRRQGQPS